MPLAFLNAKSSIFNGANPFEVSDYVRANVGSHSLSLSSRSQGSASLSHRKAGGLDLCRLSYGARARVISEGLADIYHLQFILRGYCRYTLPHSTLDLSAGHFLVLNPDDPLDITYSEDCEKFIVKLPATMLGDACAEHRWTRSRERITFKQVPYRFQELESLIVLLQLICEEAESALTTPQMLQHYNRVVTTKLMTMLEHNLGLEEPCQHAPCFERLVQYINDNIKQDISAEQLSHFSRLSLRSLYLLFEKNAKTTPKQFIRQKKLEHVHATLTNPASKAPNVTAVALEYGFTHLGRFSELYRSTFGMLPSEAMKSRLSS